MSITFFNLPTLGVLGLALGLSACEGTLGPQGDHGTNGVNGPNGSNGANGANGVNGDDGTDGDDGDDGDDGAAGDDGSDGENGENGADGEDADPVLDPTVPLSGVVAMHLADAGDTGARDIPTYVKALVDGYADGTINPRVQFPLAAASTDTVRALAGLKQNVVVRWLDPLTWDGDVSAPHFGANADYVAYFGDGWNDTPGAVPQFNGSGSSAWMWVNHEYVSGDMPTPTSAPTGQALILARWLRYQGVLENDVTSSIWAQVDVDTFIEGYRKGMGGTWMHVLQDPSTGDWVVDLGADNQRYDSTSATLARITGLDSPPTDHDDLGRPLALGVVSGIMGDCSGGVTPWGTIITAEENVQDYYGDLEACWTSDQKFKSGAGFDAGGDVSLVVAPSTSSQFGVHSDVNTHHDRDLYGYLVEMDPGEAPDEYENRSAPGVGHKRLGAFGRARWENASFAVGSDWNLVDGQPVVVYAADDRRGGRIFKFVSRDNWAAGMSEEEARELLDHGTLYASHFEGLDNSTGRTLLATGTAPTEAAPGEGRWVEISVDSLDLAPNAAALGDSTRTVGDALSDADWNGIGAFPNDDTALKALFTACAKVGIMELNRPEDVEWNPLDPSGTPRLYVAFTNHNRKVAVDQDGVLYDPADHAMASPTRADTLGSIFAIQEENPETPGGSGTFEYFQVWSGAEGEGDFDATSPDNLMIDDAGGVWFGTDGNFGVNGHADALYYLDLDPTHTIDNASLLYATWGSAFRVAAAPSDAEATGPAFSSDLGTLFFAVQHPGESQYSAWPAR